MISELTCTSGILDDGVLCEYFHDQYGTEAYSSIIYGDLLSLKLYDDEGGRFPFIEMDSFVKKIRETLHTLDLDLCDEESTIRIFEVQPNGHKLS